MLANTASPVGNLQAVALRRKGIVSVSMSSKSKESPGFQPRSAIKWCLTLNVSLFIG
jgi:hypothetical protein